MIIFVSSIYQYFIYSYNYFLYLFYFLYPLKIRRNLIALILSTIIRKIISNRFHRKYRNQNKYSNILSLLEQLSCFAMIISLSVMNGFEVLIHKKLINLDGIIEYTV